MQLIISIRNLHITRIMETQVSVNSLILETEKIINEIQSKLDHR